MIWLAATGCMFAENADAEALLTKARELYTGTPGIRVTAVTRDMRISLAPQPSGVAPRVLGATHTRLHIRHAPTDDWVILSQIERQSGDKVLPERKLVYAKHGSGDGVALLVNATTGEPVRAAVPAPLFRQEVLERVGLAAKNDAVFAAMFSKRSETGAAAFNLMDPIVAGVETVKGVELTKVVGKSSNMSLAVPSELILWIDAGVGLIVRAVERPAVGGGGPRVGLLTIRETLYVTDLSGGTEPADFEPEAAWALATPGILASAEFVSEQELVAQGGAASPDAGVGFGMGGGRRITPPSVTTTGTSPTPAPSTSTFEGQALNTAQMSAIVLIESSEGVGTGFVTKMRGLQFVVTNLHVIGGQQDFKVTTIHGRPIKVAGIFGAKGRDVAILRIDPSGGDLPELKLAENPVESVKLGDKIAVVGNRRGGGVATQLTGAVRGVGPDRLEVDAQFEPGNSGSPIVHLPTGEVIGVAAYSMTRELDDDTGGGSSNASKKPKTEQRWFGFRTDQIAQWEAIDAAKWRAQADRIKSFSDDSEAIYYAIIGECGRAGTNALIRPAVNRFLDSYSRTAGGTSPGAAEAYRVLMYDLKVLVDRGVKDLQNGDFYDYFRTNGYWETSIPEQLAMRAELSRRIDRAKENAASYASRVRR